MPSQPNRVETGLDRFLADDDAIEELRGKRLGVLCHSSSVTSDFEHVVDALQRLELNVVRLFAPEHGVRGVEQAMDSVDEREDSVTGIPVVSLYGDSEDSLVPQPEDFSGLDHLLIDVQDIGVRYYTYAATAWQFAEVAHDAELACWLFDRPNPLGREVEGPVVESGMESFVGTLPLPTVHGLTMGEIIGFAEQHGHPTDVRVFDVDNWSGRAAVDENEITWALPSPNMPTLRTAQVYAGMCLFEATNVSEGRGTTRPFELFGAPWLDPTALKGMLQALDLPGVRFRETAFRPTFEKYADEICRGLQLHVVDSNAYQSLATGAAILYGIHRLHRDEFDWRREPYEFVSDRPAIDLLIGHSRFRESLESNEDFPTLLKHLETPGSTLSTIEKVRRVNE
jgi:uncharacterized protein YbbC (DUF1343 family)